MSLAALHNAKSHHQALSDRLLQGDNPAEVYCEVELFYVNREALNEFDPGRCLHAKDEYDSEAYHLLIYLLRYIENEKVITDSEFTIYLREYFSVQFESDFDEEKSTNTKWFAMGLFQDLRLVHPPSETIKGKAYKKVLKIDD